MSGPKVGIEINSSVCSLVLMPTRLQTGLWLKLSFLYIVWDTEKIINMYRSGGFRIEVSSNPAVRTLITSTFWMLILKVLLCSISLQKSRLFCWQLCHAHSCASHVRTNTFSTCARNETRKCSSHTCSSSHLKLCYKCAYLICTHASRNTRLIKKENPLHSPLCIREYLRAITPMHCTEHFFLLLGTSWSF